MRQTACRGLLNPKLLGPAGLLTISCSCSCSCAYYSCYYYSTPWSLAIAPASAPASPVFSLLLLLRSCCFLPGLFLRLLFTLPCSYSCSCSCSCSWFCSLLQLQLLLLAPGRHTYLDYGDFGLIMVWNCIDFGWLVWNKVDYCDFGWLVRILLKLVWILEIWW
jgi:hypothetical protein